MESFFIPQVLLELRSLYYSFPCTLGVGEVVPEISKILDTLVATPNIVLEQPKISSHVPGLNTADSMDKKPLMQPWQLTTNEKWALPFLTY